MALHLSPGFGGFVLRRREIGDMGGHPETFGDTFDSRAGTFGDTAAHEEPRMNADAVPNSSSLALLALSAVHDALARKRRFSTYPDALRFGDDECAARADRTAMAQPRN